MRKNLVMLALWKVLVPYDGSKESEGANVEVDMLYIVGGLVVPYRLFEHDLNIKSKITGERLDAK